MSLRAKQGKEQTKRPAAQTYEDDCRSELGFLLQQQQQQQSSTARLLALFLRVGYA